eukprot:jgi/Antlo1/450/1780
MYHSGTATEWRRRTLRLDREAEILQAYICLDTDCTGYRKT